MQSSLSMKGQQQQQLQISSFIKDPTTLKLLILAGTNIKSLQLHTVSKCINLIKLDLSCNMLNEIPISFSTFHQLKILYLHENNIFQITIQKSPIQYLSLFNNPIKNYRSKIIKKNPNLLAIDYNIISKKQKINGQLLSSYTLLKWPLVQTQANLESQEDYLNLLKAEIFVITNLYRKANSIYHIQNFIHTLKQHSHYQAMLLDLTDQMKIRKSYVLEAVTQWKSYVKKKEKLRAYLQSKGKQHLLYNNMDLRKSKRSPKLNIVIQRFLISIRQRMLARKILQPFIRNYRLQIPVSKNLVELYRRHSKLSNTKQSNNQQSHKLYFLKSQLHMLQKIFLYSKRLLFNKKQYDLCDSFQKLIHKDKKSYYVFRIKQKSKQQTSFLIDSIRRTIGMIIRQKDLDRKYLLYNRKGHKQIAIKTRPNHKITHQQQTKLINKVNLTTSKLDNKFQNYDLLVSYSITDKYLYELLIKILRYFNAGNSSIILSNQTAYFQTEVSFEQEKQQKKQKMFVGLQFFIKRMIAANIIQRSWRRFQQKRHSQIKIIQQIGKSRSCKLISHWLGSLVFHHRLLLSKSLSYLSTILKSCQIYIQLDIYTHLIHPTNWLKLQKYQSDYYRSNQRLYQCLHQDSHVQIVQISRRRWVRFTYKNNKYVINAQKLFIQLTFKYYYNGFYLRLFNVFQTQQQNMLSQYQSKVKHLYRIDVKLSDHTQRKNNQLISKRLTIDNNNAYFVWPQGGHKELQQKFKIQPKSTQISIFIYNKHQKPLKINCQLQFLITPSLYPSTYPSLKSSLATSFRSHTPTKKYLINEKSILIQPDQIRNHYINKLRSSDKRDRRMSEIQPHQQVGRNRSMNRRVSEHLQVELLAQTLNVRRK